MPRRYTSKRTRVIRARVKWSPHMETVNDNLQVPSGVSNGYYPYVVCANAGDSHLPSVPVVQVTRINFQGHAQQSISNGEWYLYFIYVPEGIDSTLTSWAAWQLYINAHPEYIMARTIANSDYSGSGTNTTTSIRLSTRMKRNLNSGDQVIALFVWELLGSTTANFTFPIKGQISYYTKVN